MSHRETPIRSASKITMLAAGLACSSLMIMGCKQVPGKQKPENPARLSALSSLVFEGPELYDTLRTCQISSIQDLPTGLTSPDNPHLSTEDSFVQAVARAGSQGRLGKDGIRAGLFARYSSGQNQLGFYGLEAETEKDADQREQALREIWAHNGSLGRSRVYRKELILLVVWHGDISSECWASVNATVTEKLKTAPSKVRK